MMFDVIVVGGGPAGLSAALMLGRCRRRVLICDAGKPRNAQSRALHGYLTRDGIAPADFARLGREELAPYGIEFRPAAVSDAQRSNERFVVSLEGGGDEVGRFLLIATGVCDELPDIPGLAACYGRSVFHCPYCDGWERRDRPLAVLGSGTGAARLTLSLRLWSQDIVLCLNGGRLGQPWRGRAERNGIKVRPERISRIDHTDGQLSAVAFDRGEPLEREAIFFSAGQHPSASLAVRLGCRINRRGTVDTGGRSDTNVPGVFVAGDASRDAQFVVIAAAEGVKAALAINQELQRQELVP